jgi:UDP-glucose 4-epimerase
VNASRILITGLSTHWGGRIAQALERDPRVEAIIGIDTDDPRRELERTEFVRVDTRAPLIRRILGAAAVDTVVDTGGAEVDVAATAGLLEACAGPGSPVRKLVFKSSARYYGSEADDPAFFTEEMIPRHPPRTAIERDVLDVEQALRAFAASNPATAVTVLRVTTEIGAELRARSLALSGLPIVPGMVGFDPRCQFVHEDDVVGALVHACHHDLPGVYNVAADGVLALSEVAALLGKPLLPILLPWGTTLAAAGLRRLGFPVPLEEPCSSYAPSSGCGRCCAVAVTPIATSAKWRSSCAGARACATCQGRASRRRPHSRPPRHARTSLATTSFPQGR